MKTAFEIGKDLNLTMEAVHIRLKNANIKGKIRAGSHYFTDEQIKKVSFKRYTNKTYPKLSHPATYNDQIEIIEMMLSLDKINISEISSLLGIEYLKCYRTIKLFEERKCLIIKSKL